MRENERERERERERTEKVMSVKERLIQTHADSRTQCECHLGEKVSCGTALVRGIMGSDHLCASQNQSSYPQQDRECLIEAGR